MGILFVAGFSPIVDDPAVGQAFHTDTLGLPRVTVSGDYMTMDDLGGTRTWGSGRSLTLSNPASGQVITRLLGPEGLLIGICHTPWMHET